MTPWCAPAREVALDGPVFHVGLPKTATTFLQQRFFPRLGIPFYTTHRDAVPRSMDWIYRINGPWLDERRPRCERKVLLEEIARREIRLAPELAGRPAILSSEGLCGVSYDPLLNSGPIARRLAGLYPGGRAVLCVRDHAAWCESIYRQLVIHEDRFGRFVPFDHLFATKRDADALVHASDLRWADLCGEWMDAFGQDRVLVLSYERLQEDPKGFLADLARFIAGREVEGIDTDPTINASAGRDRYRATPILRKVARFAGAVVAGDRSRAAWEARTIPLAMRDRSGACDGFPGLDDDTCKRIAACTREDRDRLGAILRRQASPASAPAPVPA